jgi:hypothetical protein
MVRNFGVMRSTAPMRRSPQIILLLAILIPFFSSSLSVTAQTNPPATLPAQQPAPPATTAVPQITSAPQPQPQNPIQPILTAPKPSEPQSLVERFQTLIAGVLAIVAAAVALWGSHKQADATLKAAIRQYEGANAQAEATVRAARENIEFVQKSNTEQLKRAEDRLRMDKATDQLVLASIVSMEALRLDELVQHRQFALNFSASDAQGKAVIQEIETPPSFKLQWRDLALLGDQAVDHLARMQGLLITFNALANGQPDGKPINEAQRLKQLQEICAALRSRTQLLLDRLKALREELSPNVA